MSIASLSETAHKCPRREGPWDSPIPVPEPLAVQLDDAEWAALYGECGSCCRPVADCCGGCVGRFCQVCRERR